MNYFAVSFPDPAVENPFPSRPRRQQPGPTRFTTGDHLQKRPTKPHSQAGVGLIFPNQESRGTTVYGHTTHINNKRPPHIANNHRKRSKKYSYS